MFITQDALIQSFRKSISEECQIDFNEIDPDTDFQSLGLDSINSIFVLEKIESELGIEIDPVLYWDYPTIRSFSDHIIKDLLTV